MIIPFIDNNNPFLNILLKFIHIFNNTLPLLILNPHQIILNTHLHFINLSILKNLFIQLLPLILNRLFRIIIRIQIHLVPSMEILIINIKNIINTRYPNIKIIIINIAYLEFKVYFILSFKRPLTPQDKIMLKNLFISIFRYFNILFAPFPGFHLLNFYLI